MEEIFKQSFNYAKIKLFKNYSNLRMKCVVYDSDEPVSGLPRAQPHGGEVDPFNEFGTAPMMTPKKHVVSVIPTEKSCHALDNLNLYKKSPRNFFYTTNPTDSFVNHGKRNHPTVHCDVVKLVNAKSMMPGQHRPDYFEVTKNEQIKRHYNNPFASIEIYKVERWIKREGNKVKIKYFRQDKSRKVGSKYYRKNTSSVTLTFDMVKGNFLIVTYESHKKKKIKHFYCNSFLSLEQALSKMLNIKEHSVSRLSPLHKIYESKFNNMDFHTACTDALGIENHLFSELAPNMRAKEFVAAWMPKFVELKQIKIPNDGRQLLKHFYPTEKYLKKNDRKLVASILDRFGILSKLTVKILHENPNMELRFLIRLCNLFGDKYPKYIGNIGNHFFGGRGNLHLGEQMGSRHILIENVVREVLDVTDRERENMVHIINDLSNTQSPSLTTNVIEQFYDHFNMLKRLRFYYPELRLTVRKWETFTNEHSRISAMERNIRKGFSIHNIFENHILEAIEKPIEIISYPGTFKTKDFEKLGDFTPQRDVYTPVLLRTSEQYVDEGAAMHHCVAGYIEHSRSIIVSLRHKDERVTCEFNARDKRRKQARSYQNTDPPQHFEKALQMLDDQIKRIPLSIEPVDRQKIPLKINGISIKPAVDEEVWDIDLF